VEGPEGETLTIVPRRERCRFGNDCLVVGFEATGFSNGPPFPEFTCEFASGARFTFRFSGTSVERACTTNDVGDSITIVIGGVRSATIVNTG
jgi:hypothetical protein